MPLDDDTPKLHRLLLKRCALGDKEGYESLKQMYYDIDPWDRESFLARVINESDKTRKKLKDLELLALEEKEAALADEEDAEHCEEGREDVRAEGARGNDLSP